MLNHKIIVGALLGISLMLMGGLPPVTSVAKASSTTTTALKAHYRSLGHHVYNQKNSYQKTPRFKAHFFEGQLNDNYTADVTNWVNYYRRLSGLPPLTNDQAHNREAQIAAADMAASNQLSHGLVNVNKPNYISAHDWAIGQKVTRISNLGEMYQNQSNEKTVGSYVLDNYNVDGGNTAHRAWMLSPNITKYSVGMAYQPGARFAFSNFYWVDGLANKVVAHRKAIVLYPNAGVFPKKMVATAKKAHPVYWSAYFTHKVKTSGQMKVTIEDLHTHKTYQGTHVSADKSDYYGDFYMTVSYLPGKTPLKAKHQYRVRIKGLSKYRHGYSYKVKLY